MLVAKPLAFAVGVTAWVVVIGGVLVPLGATVLSLCNTEVWADSWQLDGVERAALRRSLSLGLCGAVGALVVALPAARCLAEGGRGTSLVLAATLVPLLIPPYAYTYAWNIVLGLPALRDTPLASSSARAWWVTVSWLWPLPALMLASGWRRTGRPVMELALLDASPGRAFLHAGLPAMRPYAVASLMVVFFISVADSSVSDLSLLRTYAWVLLSSAQVRVPLGAVVIQAWPVLAALVVAAVIAAVEVRAVARWGETHDEALSPRVSRSFGALFSVVAVLAVTVLVPIAALLLSLRRPEAWWVSVRTLLPEWRGSLAIGLVVGLLCGVVAAWFGATRWRTGWSRRLAAVAVIGVVLTGVLPGAVTGHAAAWAYNRMDWLHRACEALTGDAYAYEPAVWVLGLTGRFAFVALVLAYFAGRRVPGSLADQMRVDGGGFAEVWTHVWLPGVWSTLLVGGLIGAALVLGEVIISTLLCPPGNWSIAVTLLNQMHFGRYDQTVASTLLLVAPALVLAPVFAGWMRFRERTS